jgi:hypothetical protein
MEVHNLDFARIVLLRDDIAEVIVNQNVEMDSAMIDAYHAFLVGHLRAPFSLLINKINTYSYTFEAQRKLVAIPEINAMAAVVYSQTSQLATEALARQQRGRTWNLRIFYNREEALAWLEAEQEKRRAEPTP